jgi:hypothetical protein
MTQPHRDFGLDEQHINQLLDGLRKKADLAYRASDMAETNEDSMYYAGHAAGLLAARKAIWLYWQELNLHPEK